MFTKHTQPGSPSQVRSPFLAPDKVRADLPPASEVRLARFTPSPALEAAIIERLADPHASLYNIATENQTSVEALSLWMSRPEIAARIDAIESVVLRRARFVARNFLPAAARTAAHILSIHQARTTRSDPTPRDALNQLRADAIALRAANTLLRIANFTERQAKRASEAPSPREGVGGGRTPASNFANASSDASPLRPHPPSDIPNPTLMPSASFSPISASPAQSGDSAPLTRPPQTPPPPTRPHSSAEASPNAPHAPAPAPPASPHRRVIRQESSALSRPLPPSASAAPAPSPP